MRMVNGDISGAAVTRDKARCSATEAMVARITTDRMTEQQDHSPNSPRWERSPPRWSSTASRQTSSSRRSGQRGQYSGQVLRRRTRCARSLAADRPALGTPQIFGGHTAILQTQPYITDAMVESSECVLKVLQHFASWNT